MITTVFVIVVVVVSWAVVVVVFVAFANMLAPNRKHPRRIVDMSGFSYVSGLLVELRCVWLETSFCSTMIDHDMYEHDLL